MGGYSPRNNSFSRIGGEKMNNYYHQLQLTFNAWYLVLPICMLAMGMIGSRRYYLEPSTMRIKKKGAKLSLLTFIAMMLIEILLITLVVKESSAGILQFCANSLAVNDNAFYALILAFLAQVILFMVFYGLLYGAVKIGEYAQLGYLMEKRREAKTNQVVTMFPN